MIPIQLRAAALICALLLGVAPAHAGAETAAPKSFEDRLNEFVRTLDNNPRLKDLSHERRKGIVEFVAGNMLFVLLHEMGHAHITEQGLPVLGREEDAADSFAVVTMLKMGSSFSHRMLVQAAMGWFLNAYRDQQQGIKLAFYDEHGLNQQRAYQIVCLMVGSNPARFDDLAKEASLPEDREATCRGDYSNASWSWDMVLKPHRRTAGQPQTKIEAIYGDGGENYGMFAESFHSIRLLETVAERASEEYVWRAPFAMEFRTCGRPWAGWNLPARRLTVCYELAADLAQLYRDYSERPDLPHLRLVDSITGP